MFQIEWCVNDHFCLFHEDNHPEGFCLEWKRVANLVCNRALNVVISMQFHPRDTNDDEDVAPDEAPNTRKVINIYQCPQAAQTMNTKKQPQKQTGRYNLMSQGTPPTFQET